MKYKVSVIIPVYNVGRCVEKCARSLFEQSLDDIEYIFVDDCSPDNSLSIVKSVSEDYPKRKNNIKYLVHDKNRGLTTTRNTGLAVATGEFIAHCDSDDWVDVAMYEKLYNHAVEENADVCFSNFNFVYGNRSETYECTSVYVDKIQTINAYIGSGWTVLWNMIARRKLYTEHQLKSPENISYCEDFHLSVRLFHYAQKIVKIDEPLYYYNQMNVYSIMHGFNKKDGSI